MSILFEKVLSTPLAFIENKWYFTSTQVKDVVVWAQAKEVSLTRSSDVIPAAKRF